MTHHWLFPMTGQVQVMLTTVFCLLDYPQSSRYESMHYDLHTNDHPVQHEYYRVHSNGTLVFEGLVVRQRADDVVSVVMESLICIVLGSLTN